MTVPPEGHIKGMVCARCDVWIQHRFIKPLSEIAHMIIGDEFLTVEDFEIELYCPVCGRKSTTTARNLCIDIKKQIIVRCEFDPPHGDMTPPDYVPDF